MVRTDAEATAVHGEDGEFAAQFARLPHEYRKPFEDMGISGEETSPAIMIPQPPAKPSDDVDLD